MLFTGGAATVHCRPLSASKPEVEPKPATAAKAAQAVRTEQRSVAPPLPKLEDAPRPPTADIFRQLCGLHKHQAHHEVKVQQAMFSHCRRQSHRPQFLRLQSEIVRGGGASGALDVLRSRAHPPPSDVYAARGGGANGANLPVLLQTQVEETPSPGDFCAGGGATSHAILRHYQQLEIWPLGVTGEHPMRLGRQEFAVGPPSTPESQATEETIRSVAVEFRVHGQERAIALVLQWEKILSPEDAYARTFSVG